MVAPVGIISHKLAQIAGFNFVLTEKARHDRIWAVPRFI